MNKKGFTLVELLVTIAISTLVLSLGTISVNQLIKNSEQKTITIAHENIKKSANLYSKEFYDEIIWSNNQSCISLDQLISKGYIRKDKTENANLKYVIIEKDKNNTIISEKNSDGSDEICGAIINETVAAPTSKDICNDLNYDGTPKTIHKGQAEIGDIYILPEEDIIESDVGSYAVPITLNRGYRWKDNSTNEKNVYCTIKKGEPKLTLSSTKQSAEQTIPTKIILTSTVNGTLDIKSSNNKYATATSTDLTGGPGNYTSTITINNNANRKTNTYITITLIPFEQDKYQTASTTYTIGDITDIKREKPTSATYCTNPYYNSLEQKLTEAEKIGYTFYNNTATDVGKYTVTAKLHPGFEWKDGSKKDITFECEIKDLTYKVHYVGNGNTGQTYDDASQCTDNKCGLNRYTSGSKVNSNPATFEHTRKYIYGLGYKLVHNRFTKTGYSFNGWAKSESGTVTYTNQQNVSNLIDPKTDKNGTIVKLYAKWEPNTYTVTYNGNGGSSSQYGTTWSETATYDKNYKTQSNWYSRTGYTFKGWNEKSDGSGTDWTDYINKDWKWTYTQNITLYAQWKPNKIKLTFDSNGGSGGMTNAWYYYGTNTFYSDEACTKKITSITKPTRTGYTFVHYYGDGTSGGTAEERYAGYENVVFATDLSTDIYKDATLYAKWTPNKIKLTFNANGGSGGMTNAWYYYGTNTFYSNEACTNIITSITKPTRTGHAFIHYYGDGTSGGTAGERYAGYDNIVFATDLSTDIYKDATLYAKWEQTLSITINKEKYRVCPDDQEIRTESDCNAGWPNYLDIGDVTINGTTISIPVLAHVNNYSAPWSGSGKNGRRLCLANTSNICVVNFKDFSVKNGWASKGAIPINDTYTVDANTLPAGTYRVIIAGNDTNPDAKFRFTKNVKDTLIITK